MRLHATFLAVVTTAVLASPAPAADAPTPKGVETGDLDRSVEPCTDFFEFANGTWRAQNPIPPSMVRWSRRWAAGESAKEQLKTILDEVSARPDWPKGSVEQLIGDHYAACMDEAKVDALGLEPLKPLLAEIDGVTSMDGVQKVIRRFHEIAIPVPFGLYAASDNHEPTQVIANVFASGLGLPDRDYYVKTEPRFQEAREKYKVHVAHMLELAGASRADSRKAADAVFAFEKQLAEASLDNVALRDPQGHRPQDDVRRPHEPRAHVRLAGVLRRGEAAAGRPQRAAAGVHEGPRPPARPGHARRLEDVPALAPRALGGAVALQAVRRGELRVLREVPRRGGGDEAALEALRGVDGRAARRGARARSTSRSTSRRRRRRACRSS